MTSFVDRPIVRYKLLLVHGAGGLAAASTEVRSTFVFISKKKKEEFVRMINIMKKIARTYPAVEVA